MHKQLRLKLNTRLQAEALLYYFQLYVVPSEPENTAESLLKDLMMRIFKKLRNKVEKYDTHGWSITVSPEEAKAYVLYWNNRAFEPNYPLEKLIVQTHLNQIDQAYA
jgi:hypothetical protein